MNQKLLFQSQSRRSFQSKTMSSVESLREFVTERLTAAAEEILGVFQKTIVKYEEEIDRQRRLLEVNWKPEVNLHRIKLPQQHVCREEERSSSLDQEAPEPPQIKEEEEDLCSSQEGEQLVLKQETETLMVTPVYEEDDHSEDQTLDLKSDETLEESVVDMSVINSVVSEENRDLQLLSNNSHVAESQDQSKKKSHTNNVDNPIMLESRCSPQKRKMYSCDTCGNKLKLQRPLRVHAIEKPYLLKCDLCGRDFKRKAGLEEHQRFHTNEKLCRQENQTLRGSSHSQCQIGGQALLEEVRAGFGQLRAALREQRTPVGPIPSSPSTPEPSSSHAQTSPLVHSFTSASSIRISHQHPDVPLLHVGPKDYTWVRERSYGQVGRYGCLLFRKIISEENYRAWCKTTNWDGSKGKHGLPQNVKDFVVETLKKQFPGMVVKDLKDCIDKINEFLRTPRRSSQGNSALSV